MRDIGNLAMPPRSKDASTVAIPSANDKRAGLPNAFFEKYKYELGPVNQPSEQTLSLPYSIYAEGNKPNLYSFLKYPTHTRTKISGQNRPESNALDSL